MMWSAAKIGSIKFADSYVPGYGFRQIDEQSVVPSLRKFVARGELL